MANERIQADIFQNFLGGQDASLSPALIPDGKYASGVNVSTDRGSLSPRWPRKTVELDWSIAGNYTKPNTPPREWREIFESCNYQAIIPYSIGSDYYLIIIVTGYMFLIDQRTLQVRVINPDDALDPTNPRLDWSPAGQWLVVFDWPNLPMLIEGIQTRRSNLDDYEVPISVLGAYNQNRLFIGNAGNEFTGGDPAGSLAAPDAPITFKEISMDSAPYVGQVFQLSTNYNNDPITAMGFIQVNDTSTGIGPLFVATANAIYMYHTELPRGQWQAGQFGSILLYNAGIIAQSAVVNVNTDLLFISNDGQLRSLSMSRNDQGQWKNTPISKEIGNYMKYSDPALKRYSFLSYFHNKLLVSCNPYRIPTTTLDGTLVHDVAFGGLGVLEMDNISGLTRDSTPAWAGLWTGMRPCGIATNNDQCFIVGKEGRRNVLYEVLRRRGPDETNKKRTPFKSIIYTRYAVSGSAILNKELHTLDLSFEKVSGKLKVSVYYRPSHLGYWTHWSTVEQEFPTRQCGAIIRFPNGLAAQSVLDMRLGGVDDTACDAAGRTMQCAYKQVQLRIEIEADDWELLWVRVKGRVLPEDETAIFCGDAAKEIPLDCIPDWRSPYGSHECS